MGDQAPLVEILEADIPRQSAGNVQDQVIGEAPFDGTVTGVTIISAEDLTADETNYRTFSVVNKGDDGEGSTLVASFATDTPETGDLAAFDEKDVTLSGTALNLIVSEGDILVVEETVTAGGVAHGSYKMSVAISRD